MNEFKVLLSAVSSKFEKARAQVGNDLVAKGLEVKVQEKFRQEADPHHLGFVAQLCC